MRLLGRAVAACSWGAIYFGAHVLAGSHRIAPFALAAVAALSYWIGAGHDRMFGRDKGSEARRVCRCGLPMINDKWCSGGHYDLLDCGVSGLGRIANAQGPSPAHRPEAGTRPGRGFKSNRPEASEARPHAQRRYTAKYRQEDGKWWAEVPSLPSWMGVASTLDGLRRLTAEGIRFVLTDGESVEPVTSLMFIHYLRTPWVTLDPEAQEEFAL